MSLTFERKLPIILTFVFFMLTIVGIFSYQSTISVREELSRQKRTRQVLDRLDDILTRSIEVDSAVMSFIILGNESYLTPQIQAEKRIAADIAELQPTMLADPQQSTDFQNLNDLITKKSAVTKSLIDLRRSTDFESSVGQLPGSSAQSVGADLRSAIDRLKKRELDLLAEHEDAVDRNMNRTIIILIVSSMAGVVALVLANLFVVLENNRRRTAEKALIKSKEELEEKVKERTLELQAANQTLVDAAAEREKLLASEQAARREAEIANRLRDEFMATVSHELRTPLNSILGWARLLKNGQLEPRQAAKAVRTIIKNSESQNRLIEDLLDVARMISGKLELDITQVPVSEFVEHSVETARPEAGKRDISIELSIDEQAREASIDGDRLRLEQIVGNLLNNAIKFSRAGESIKVAVRRDGAFVDVSVIDHGAGISREFLPLVFERFRQDRSTIKQSGGLGLGLAVVRNLTELHGGTVSVKSAGENLGSEFTLRIPVSNGDRGSINTT
jgi:signal transduction histidine kinase